MNIFKSVIITLSSLALTASLSAKPVELKSPDGRTTISFESFKYSVTMDGTQILLPSEIGLRLGDGTVYGGGAKLLSVRRKTVDQVIPALNYKKAEVRDHYNQMTLSYRDFDLVLRAYNEGVAYRFISKSKNNFIVESETAQFAFVSDPKAYVPYCKETGTLQEQTHDSYESWYEHISLSEWKKDKLAFLPLVVEAADGYKVAITEADLIDYPSMELCNQDADSRLEGFWSQYPDRVIQGGCFNVEGIVKTTKPYIAQDCKPGFTFPWRVLQIAREDTELANSDLVYRLATPAKADVDWSWVKPGKAQWDWWNDWNITGVDFKAGINNETYRYYIDFAAAHGISYVILDVGWYIVDNADLLKVAPDLDVPALAAYGAKKGVGLFLWAGYWALKRDMENLFLHYSMMGIKGFKIDIMNRSDQEMLRFYSDCAKLGVKYKMMIDFHGTFKPTGFGRTYPNILNYEGVYGLEQMKWNEDGADQVIYDVTIPFIRQVAGPMDYTQGAMRNSNWEDFRAVNGETMSPGTRCHQLAMYTVFESPFSMLCDTPTKYLQEKECLDYISQIPTVWDETRVLNGKIAEFVTIARRSGETWYLGSMTNWTPRDFTLDLSFLPEGTYTMTLYRDGANADKVARDYRREEVSVSSGDRVKIHLAPGGGWAAKISKAKP